MTPRRGNAISSLSGTLEGLFELKKAPFKGPRLTSCIASGTTEIQGHCQVCRTRHLGPRTPARTTNAQSRFASAVFDGVPRTSAPSITHLTVSLYLCSSRSNARGMLKALEGRRVSSETPSHEQNFDRAKLTEYV